MKFIYSIIIFVFGFSLGLNQGIYFYGHRHIWPVDRNGLNHLDREMAKDKSQRLGMFVITENSFYGTQSIAQEEAKIFGGFIDKNGQVFGGNVNLK